PVPLTIDLDTGFEVEREGKALLVAVLLEENPPGYDHTQMLADFHQLAQVRAPALADIRIARYTLANVDLGGDGHPYVGEVEDGSRGIGRAFVLEAARRGYTPVFSYRARVREAEETVAMVAALGCQAGAVQADLADFGSVGRLADAARAAGPVALLVNNAGL